MWHVEDLHLAALRMVASDLAGVDPEELAALVTAIGGVQLQQGSTAAASEVAEVETEAGAGAEVHAGAGAGWDRVAASEAGAGGGVDAESGPGLMPLEAVPSVNTSPFNRSAIFDRSSFSTRQVRSPMPLPTAYAYHRMF